MSADLRNPSPFFAHALGILALAMTLIHWPLTTQAGDAAGASCSVHPAPAERGSECRQPLSAGEERPTVASLQADESTRSTAEFDRGRPRAEAQALAFLLRCLTNLTTGQPANAARDCTVAIGLQPQSPSGYKLRGEAYAVEGKTDLAIADLDHAIELDSTDPETYAIRATARRTKGQVNGAISDFDVAIALSATDARLWNDRCWTRATSGIELDVALADCNKAIALNARFAAAYDSRGVVHLKLKRYVDAFADFDTALTILPGHPSGLFGRGLANIRLQRIASGRLDIRAARAADPSIDRRFLSYGISLRGLPPETACKHRPCLPTNQGKRPARRLPGPSELGSAIEYRGGLSSSANQEMAARTQ